MTAERLININKNGYLIKHNFNQEDYDKIQATLDLLSCHHSKNDRPKVGDIVEGAYYGGTIPYANGRIESIEGDEITICCHPYVPFVSFGTDGKIHLSMSGGPFFTHKLSELVFVKDDMAEYKFWGHDGACANGAISVETFVKRWRIPYEKVPVSHITEIDEIDLERNPMLDTKVILHKDHIFFFARYSNLQQLQDLSEVMGFTYTLDEEASRPGFRRYRMSHQIMEGPGFWNLDSLPENARPFTASSCGRLCTCYFVRDDKEKNIIIFRPNPNSKQVYDPMALNESIAYKRMHGEAGPVPIQ